MSSQHPQVEIGIALHPATLSVTSLTSLQSTRSKPGRAWCMPESSASSSQAQQPCICSAILRLNPPPPRCWVTATSPPRSAHPASAAVQAPTGGCEDSVLKLTHQCHVQRDVAHIDCGTLQDMPGLRGRAPLAVQRCPCCWTRFTFDEKKFLRVLGKLLQLRSREESSQLLRSMELLSIQLFGASAEDRVNVC